MTRWKKFLIIKLYKDLSILYVSIVSYFDAMKFCIIAEILNVRIWSSSFRSFIIRIQQSLCPLFLYIESGIKLFRDFILSQFIKEIVPRTYRLLKRLSYRLQDMSTLTSLNCSIIQISHQERKMMSKTTRRHHQKSCTILDIWILIASTETFSLLFSKNWNLFPYFRSYSPDLMIWQV